MRRITTLAFAIALLTAVPARAEDTTKIKEAGQHFQRAVSLYNETDYNGALVEFKRAYATAPNVNVLYNIGQSQFQLQRYAQALESFQQYLAGGGTGHKDEVQETVNVLKSRVGQVNVTTNLPGAEIAIDDENVGQSPLAKPIAVSVGRRKITLTLAGHDPMTKWIDVAAGDTVDAPLPFETPSVASAPKDASQPAEHGHGALATAGWLTTGVLASGAVVTGLLALDFSGKLRDARNAYPGNQADIASKASTTTGLAVTTDVLGGLAIVAAGVSLYLTLSHPSSPASREVKAAIGPGSFQLVGTF